MQGRTYDHKLFEMAVIAASATPSASRPWALCSEFADKKLLVQGWYKREKDAKAVARANIFFIARPIVAHLYTDTSCRS